MPGWVGLDCGLHKTSVCVLGAAGEVVSEAEVDSEREPLVAYLLGQGAPPEVVGMEASGTSRWLHIGLADAGINVVSIEAFHAHGVLKTRTNKTDRNDARGIAEMMRLGVYRPVHVKSAACRRMRLLLSVRSMLLRRQIDLEKGVRAALLEYGIKLPRGRRPTLARRVRILLLDRGNHFLEGLTREIFAVCGELERQIVGIERTISEIATSDPVCRRFMTAPGIGPLTAVAFRATVDEPRRFARSRDVGAYLGLTPRSFNSGMKVGVGRMSKRGDTQLRKLLFLAALRLMRRDIRDSWLRQWGLEVARRRGAKKAAVAIARRLAVILHRMWLDETEFRWTLSGAEGLEEVAYASLCQSVDDSGRGTPARDVVGHLDGGEGQKRSKAKPHTG